MEPSLRASEKSDSVQEDAVADVRPQRFTRHVRLGEKLLSCGFALNVYQITAPGDQHHCRKR